MPNITQKTISRFSEAQIEAFKELKKDTGWGVVQSLAQDVIKGTKLDDVDDNLPAKEYKIECQARKKTREALIQIFSDAKTLTEYTEKKKVNYS